MTLGASLAAAAGTTAAASARVSSVHWGALQQQLHELLGLEVYNQTFRVDWPYGGVRGRTCTNVHAILR